MHSNLTVLKNKEEKKALNGVTTPFIKKNTHQI